MKMGKTAFRLAVTGVASVMLVIVLLSAGYGGSSHIFMRGDLSIKHSGLRKDCAACHNKWRGVDDEKCSACHKKVSDHLPSTAEQAKLDRLKGAKCSGCHIEHDGVGHNIKSGGGGACRQCHKFRAHPEARPPSAKSVYPHGVHILLPLGMEKCYLCHVNDDETGKLTYDPNVKDGSICVGCHRGKYDKPPEIRPQTFVKNTGFKHEMHAEAKVECSECHGNLYKKSMDGFETLPAVVACVTCHGKTSGAFDCVKCHGFHAGGA